MKGTSDLTVTISDRIITFELPVNNENLVEAIFDALAEYVKEGSSLNVLQMYANATSDSTRMIRKIISKAPQMLEWRDEIRRLMCVLRKGV